jgi:hypothetical protein
MRQWLGYSLLALIALIFVASIAVPWEKLAEHLIQRAFSPTPVKVRVVEWGGTTMRLQELAVGEKGSLGAGTIIIRYRPLELLQGRIRRITLEGVELTLRQQNDHWMIPELESLLTPSSSSPTRENSFALPFNALEIADATILLQPLDQTLHLTRLYWLIGRDGSWENGTVSLQAESHLSQPIAAQLMLQADARYRADASQRWRITFPSLRFSAAPPAPIANKDTQLSAFSAPSPAKWIEQGSWKLSAFTLEGASVTPLPTSEPECESCLYVPPLQLQIHEVTAQSQALAISAAPVRLQTESIILAAGKRQGTLTVDTRLEARHGSQKIVQDMPVEARLLLADQPTLDGAIRLPYVKGWGEKKRPIMFQFKGTLPADNKQGLNLSLQSKGLKFGDKLPALSEVFPLVSDYLSQDKSTLQLKADYSQKAGKGKLEATLEGEIQQAMLAGQPLSSLVLDCNLQQRGAAALSASCRSHTASIGNSFRIEALSALLSYQKNVLSLGPIDFRFAGGAVHIPVMMADDTGNIAIDIAIRGIRLAQIAAMLPEGMLEAEGIIDGNFPFRLEGGKIQLGEVRIGSRGEGVLKVQNEALLATLSQQQQAEILGTLLKNLNYQSIRLTHDDTMPGSFSFLLAISGKNPDVYNGKLIQLNVTLSSNYLDILPELIALSNLPNRIARIFQP